jgi:hypothetical protein
MSLEKGAYNIIKVKNFGTQVKGVKAKGKSGREGLLKKWVNLSQI